MDNGVKRGHLCFSRKSGESLTIGDDIEVQVFEVWGDKVRLRICAPLSVPVHRKEVYDAIRRENNGVH